jgi:HAD superfamily hydrolase (TIGR01484 family)
MLPLSHWPLEDRRQITGVFTDIDDTLTTDGAITPDALQALADLKAAGLTVIAITGRPVGWSEPFALGWPVDAIVAENGAVALVKQRTQSPHPYPLPRGEGVNKLYQQDAATRAANYQRLQSLVQQVLREVPGTTLATDSPGRETDIAIDHSEFTHLSSEKIAQVVQIMQREGLNASVSSIHINAWLGPHNKWQGARWIARELLGRTLEDELSRWVFVGDSSNDQLMFQHFPQSIGVANIRRFEAALTTKPRYVTPGERGAGFAEVARALLDVRQA